MKSYIIAFLILWGSSQQAWGFSCLNLLNQNDKRITKVASLNWQNIFSIKPYKPGGITPIPVEGSKLRDYYLAAEREERRTEDRVLSHMDGKRNSISNELLSFLKMAFGVPLLTKGEALQMYMFQLERNLHLAKIMMPWVLAQEHLIKMSYEWSSETWSKIGELTLSDLYYTALVIKINRKSFKKNSKDHDLELNSLKNDDFFRNPKFISSKQLAGVLLIYRTLSRSKSTNKKTLNLQFDLLKEFDLPVSKDFLSSLEDQFLDLGGRSSVLRMLTSEKDLKKLILQEKEDFGCCRMGCLGCIATQKKRNQEKERILKSNADKNEKHDMFMKLGFNYDWEVKEITIPSMKTSEVNIDDLPFLFAPIP